MIILPSICYNIFIILPSFYYDKGLLILKKWYSVKEERLLTFKEINALSWKSALKPAEWGVRLLENTPEEILDVMMEEPDDGLRMEITPQSAGWEHIWFQSRTLAAGATWSFDSGEHELALVVLTVIAGFCRNSGLWPKRVAPLIW